MRQPLPNRRHCETFDFVHDGIKYFATVGFDCDWNVKELFVVGGKPGTAVEAMARDAAVIVSRALQEGISVEELRGSLTRLDKGEAAGPVCKALDLVAGAA